MEMDLNMFAHIHTRIPITINHQISRTENLVGFVLAFNIDSEDIKSKDFYILTDPAVNDNLDFHSSWILDTPNKAIVIAQNFTSNPIAINSIISELSENKSREIFVLHILVKRRY